LMEASSHPVPAKAGNQQELGPRFRGDERRVIQIQSNQLKPARSKIIEKKF
jgi:hypothetical protein